ncbi:MAG: DUF4870 domain-containing protein [Chloroflexi bacterium]|nr:DUF4870 domain-containing protein [Chloroflexota bacterium]
MSEQPVNPDITSDDKLWALLGYIFSPLIPLIMLLMEDKKSRPFIKFHAVQAIVLGIIQLVFYMVLGWIFIGLCLGLALFSYMIYLGVKAYNGEYVEVPGVTNFIKNQNWV